MKNYSVLVVLVLFLTLIIFFHSMADEQLHLFLDIPFGISTDECRQLIRQKYGFVLDEELSYEDGDQKRYSITNPDTVDLYGLPFTVAFYFLDDQLTNVNIFCTLGTVSDEIDTFLSDSLDQFFAFLELVEQSYGAPMDGKLYVIDNEYNRDYFDYPVCEGIRDEDMLRRFFVDLKDPTTEIVAIMELYGNVNISVLYTSFVNEKGYRMWSTGISLIFFDNLQLPKEALGGTEPFYGREGAFPGLQEGN